MLHGIIIAGVRMRMGSGNGSGNGNGMRMGSFCMWTVDLHMPGEFVAAAKSFFASGMRA